MTEYSPSFITNFEAYRDVLKAFNLDRHSHVYTIIEVEEFEQILQKDISLGNKIYVRELLYRAHIAAITTLLRNAKWMSGLSSAQEKPNYFAFSACLRGLVESAADSAYCLDVVPKTLAMHFKDFSIALGGKFSKGIICANELEDQLIHYSHGAKQRKTSNVPKAHHAEPSQEYLKVLEAPDSAAVRNLYSELCEITHPATRTIAIFITRTSITSNQYHLTTGMDMDLIGELVLKHDKAFDRVFQMSFNAALLTLSILNTFPDPAVHTFGLDSIRFDDIPGYREIENILKKV